MTSSQIVALAALALLLASVVCDLRDRTIPDWISVALLALGVASTALGWHDLGWLPLAIGAAVAFGTEGGLFQEAGYSVVVCGPGSIDQAHRPDEFIEIAQVQACEKFLHDLARSVARQPVL